MEFITVEQFKEQSKEVQKVFLDWWKCEVFDIYAWSFDIKANKWSIATCDNQIQADAVNENKRISIPLFTEGQLRKFIEEKAKCKVMIEYTSCENIVIKICREDEVTGSLRWNRKVTVPSNKFDLINSYWKVACMIAKEEVDG